MGATRGSTSHWQESLLNGMISLLSGGLTSISTGKLVVASCGHCADSEVGKDISLRTGVFTNAPSRSQQMTKILHQQHRQYEMHLARFTLFAFVYG